MVRPSSSALAPPFGVLNGVHQRALQAAALEPVPSVVFLACVVPLLPLFLQTWLILGEQSGSTRAARKLLAGASVVVTWYAWLGYRFVGGWREE